VWYSFGYLTKQFGSHPANLRSAGDIRHAGFRAHYGFFGAVVVRGRLVADGAGGGSAATPDVAL
jgi:hypothetical protein